MKQIFTNRTTGYCINSAKSFGLFVCMALLIPYLGMSQFVVKKNTMFITNTSLVSFEAVNIFESNLLGSGTFYLNGYAQSFYAHNDISIPTLQIAHASELDIISELSIRGALTLKSGRLKLKHPVYLQGNLHVLNDALIYNYSLIKFLTEQLSAHKNAWGSITHYSNMASVLKRSHSCDLFLDGFDQKNNVVDKNLFYKSPYTTPLQPPPEFISYY